MTPNTSSHSSSLPFTTDSDHALYPFLITSLGVRGRGAQISQIVDTILRQHHYPDPISLLLGELIVITSLLADMLKYEQLITLQVESNGIVTHLIADVMEGGKIRAYASYDKERYHALMQEKETTPDLQTLCGSGYLVISIDPRQEQRYQGIVALDQTTLTHSIEHYFQQSEQVDTRFRIHVQQAPEGSKYQWIANGMMVQKLAEEGGTLSSHSHIQDEDHWEKAALFVASLTAAELGNPILTIDQLLYRLFHDEEVKLYPPTHFSHGCRCSREKAENMLKGLPPEELLSLAENEKIEVTCQFCGKQELFTL